MAASMRGTTIWPVYSATALPPRRARRAPSSPLVSSDRDLSLGPQWHQSVRVRTDHTVVEILHFRSLEADDERVRYWLWISDLRAALTVMVVDVEARLRQRRGAQLFFMMQARLPLVAILSQDRFGFAVEVCRRKERPGLRMFSLLAPFLRLRVPAAVRTERNFKTAARVRGRVLGIHFRGNHQARRKEDIALQRDVGDRNWGAKMLPDRQVALEDHERLVIVASDQLKRVGFEFAPANVLQFVVFLGSRSMDQKGANGERAESVAQLRSNRCRGAEGKWRGKTCPVDMATAEPWSKHTEGLLERATEGETVRFYDPGTTTGSNARIGRSLPPVILLICSAHRQHIHAVGWRLDSI